MKLSFDILAMILICITGFSQIGYSQPVYKIEDTKDIEMKLLGTSTLHKWEMDAKTVTGEAQFDFKFGSKNELNSLKSLTFALEVKDLQSDSKGLNKNAYAALKLRTFTTNYHHPHCRPKKEATCSRPVVNLR